MHFHFVNALLLYQIVGLGGKYTPRLSIPEGELASHLRHDYNASKNSYMRSPRNVTRAFKTFKENETTSWFQREIQKGHINLLVTTTAYDEDIVNEQNLEKIIIQHDSIGKAFIPGRLPNSYLITEKAYEPYIYSTTFGKKPAVEIRGTWEVQGDFMAGPFLQYIINDKPNNRNIVLEGFVFAPSRAKRDYIFEIETVLRSLQESR